jgi:hypothetical protein
LHATVLQIIDRSVKEERVPTATTVFTGGVSSMDAFLQRFFPEVYRRMKGGGERVSNYCRFDSQLLTAFTSSLYVAGLVSTFFASSVTARCGRRPSMIVAGVAIRRRDRRIGRAYFHVDPWPRPARRGPRLWKSGLKPQTCLDVIAIYVRVFRRT